MAIRLGKLKINRLWMLVGMALVLGLLATWLSVSYLRGREEALQAEMAEQAKNVKTVTVVVPTQDLKKGAMLTASVVAGRDIQADLVFEDMVLADNFDAIKGKPLLRGVEKGKPITREDVIDNRPAEFSRLLANGMRALTVDIDELNSIAQMLKPGDFIDLNFITADASSGGGGQQIFPLLQHVKVIATGTRTQGGVAPDPLTMTEEQRDALMKYGNVTVEVTPEEAGYIALAQATGRIRVTLRPPTDEGVRGYGPLTSAQLSGGPARVAGSKAATGAGDKPAATTKVEYILGGGASTVQTPININVPGLPGFPGTGAPAGAGAAGTPNTGGLNLSGLPPSAGLALGNAISQANPNAPR